MSYSKIPRANLKFGEVIGVGGSSTVYRVEWSIIQGLKNEKRAAAAKKQYRVDTKELEMLARFSHPNIVKLLGVVDEHPDFYLILELCEGGSLYGYLKNHDLPLHPALSLTWAEMAARPIEYLQQKKVIHRDLKSKNYLISASKVLKLADFDIAKEDAANTVFTKLRGTAAYIAPEGFAEEVSSPRSDIFALAIVIWELLTRRIPFEGCEWENMMYRVALKGERLEIPADCPPEISQLLTKCWEGNRYLRPTIADVLQVIHECRLKQIERSISAGEDLSSIVPPTQMSIMMARDKRRVSLELPPSATISSMKGIMKENGIQDAERPLCYRGQLVRNDMPVAAYDTWGDNLEQAIVVIVKTREGRKCRIEAFSSETVGDIKQKLAAEGIPDHSCTLGYHGKRLKDEDSLAHHEIHDEDTIYQAMVLSITSPSGSTRDIEAFESDSVAELKVRMAEEDIPSSELTLAYGGRPLHDKQILFSLGVKQRDTLEQAITVQLFIHSGKSSIVVETFYSQKVGQLKNSFEKESQLFIRKLGLNCKQLDNAKTIRDCGIKDGDTIEMASIVTIENNSGHLYRFEIEAFPSETVSDIKRKMAAKEIPNHSYTLGYRNKRLKDEDLLAQHGIHGEVTLYQAMVLPIRLCSGRTQNIEAFQSDSVANLQKRMEKGGIPSSHLSLARAGKRLNSNQILSSLRIKHGDTLEQAISVQILLYSGKSFKMETFPRQTVASLKAELRQKRRDQSHATSTTHLGYHGKLLEEEESISSYGIRNGDIVEEKITVYITTSSRTPTGTTYLEASAKIQVFPSQTIGDVKRKHRYEGLGFKGEWLKDTKTMSAYGVGHNTHLERAFSISIRTFEGKTITWQTFSSQKVGHIKESLQAVNPLYSSRELGLRRTVLNDNKTANECGIGEGDTLEQTLELTFEKHSGETKPLKVFPSANIGEVMHRLKEMRIRDHNLELGYKGSQLRHGLAVEACGIRDGDTINQALLLFIKTHSGKKEGIHVFRKDTIGRCMERMKMSNKFHYHDRSLWYDGKCLSNEATLSGCGIKHGANLEQAIMVTVLTTTGKKVHLETCPSQTVNDVKQTLGNKYPRSFDRNLGYEGKLLSSDKTLSDCKITEGAILEQTIKVSIITSSGRKEYQEALPSETLSSLMTKMNTTRSLGRKGIKLSAEDSLSHHGIKEGDTLEQAIKVSILTYTGRQVCVWPFPSTTIAALPLLMRSLEPRDLAYQGERLDKDKKLSDYSDIFNDGVELEEEMSVTIQSISGTLRMPLMVWPSNTIEDLQIKMKELKNPLFSLPLTRRSTLKNKLLPEKEALSSCKIIEGTILQQAMSKDKPDEIRVVLIGVVGAGKSATGNSILGKQSFKENDTPNPVTLLPETKREDVMNTGIYFSITDTPGLKGLTSESSKVNLNLLCQLAPGPHAILFVVRAGRISEDTMDTFEAYKEFFGANFVNYVFLVFTHIDQFQNERDPTKNKTLDQYIEEIKHPTDGSTQVAQILEMCNNRYLGFHNRLRLDSEENGKQTREFIDKVAKMVASNGGKCYSSKSLEEAEELMQGIDRKTGDRHRSRAKTWVIYGLDFIPRLKLGYKFNKQWPDVIEEAKQNVSDFVVSSDSDQTERQLEQP